MEPKKVEWFAIVEPCTKEEIYVNMFTGECVWHPPHGALVKKADDNLWWEIFDPNSSRFYYYNAANQKTVWQKPQNSDVLSLSKLQALKQSIYDCSNGDIKKESTATQTTTKISAKNIHKNVGLQKSASTQTASYSPVKEKFKQGFSSRSEHALSAYSYDSGCSGDSSIASQSHSSLDSTNYQCYRKLEFCSAESVDSSYFQDQNVVPPGRISWHETKQWAKRGPHLEFSSSQDSGHPMQRPVLGNIVPVWQQHSFECWQAPPPHSAPKQHSFDLSSVSRRQQQPFGHSKGKSCMNFVNANDQMQRSTPQHYRTKNSLSFGLDQIQHVSSSYVLENNTAYPPEAVGTPLASRRQWLVNGSKKVDDRKAESNLSSPQNPLRPLENLQSFKRSKNNIQASMSKYPPDHGSSSYKQQRSLDLPLYSYNNPRNTQGKDGRYLPELIMSVPQHHAKSKMSPDFQVDSYQRENMLTRQRYYNSCKHIYTCQNEHSSAPHTYTTPDFSIPCCYQAENYLSPLQQYLMEQAKLSGKLTDLGDDKDSYSQSDDDSDGQRDDDDHFADDEGMSRHDSSSLEYLDNYVFFDEQCGDMYYPPVVNPSYPKGKPNHQDPGFKFPKGYEAEDTSSMFPMPDQNQQPGLPSYYEAFLDKSDEHLDYPDLVDETEEFKTEKGDIEKYAEDNLNRHTKGIFRKKFSLQDMLSWSKDPIRKPMITTTDKSLKRDACEVFKLIQTYMLDHKTKSGQTYEAVVLDLATRGWGKPALRDELYIQICRQTTENPKSIKVFLLSEMLLKKY